MQFAIVAMLATLGPHSASSETPEDSLGRARTLVAAALSADPSTFVAAADEAYLAEAGGREQLLARLREVRTRAGAEVAVIEDRTYRGGAGITYDRYARFGNVPLGRIFMRMSPDGRSIRSFRFTPVAPRRSTALGSYESRVRLRLPFGQPPPGMAWNVTWAGASLADNYHPRPDTQFAMDVSPRALNDPRPSSSVEDVACWGMPILAAADGIVAKAQDGMPDHRLNDPAATGGPGNHVIIDHGNSEFTLYAHLRSGSVAARAGRAVRSGDVVGLCGNSGGSPEPHLHFQLMNHADLDRAEGLPLRFHDYFAPLRHVAVGSPVRGDVLLPGLAPRP